MVVEQAYPYGCAAVPQGVGDQLAEDQFRGEAEVREAPLVEFLRRGVAHGAHGARLERYLPLGNPVRAERPGPGDEQGHVVGGPGRQQHVEHGPAALVRVPVGVAEGRAQQFESLADVPGPFLDQPVRVEDELAAFREVQLRGFEGHAAQPQWGSGRQLHDLRRAVGGDHQGWQVAGPRHRAALGHGVVDGVQAGRAQYAAVHVVTLPVVVDALYEVVQAGQDLVGRQVEGGEVVHGRAQAPHGGGGVQAVPDDVADDQRDAAAGEGDHVEPVAADPGLCGQVEVRHVHGALLGQGARQQAALEGHGEGVFPGVAAGVVHADRGAGDEFLGQGQLVLVEGLLLLRPPEVDHAEYGAPGHERGRDEGVDAVVHDGLGARRILCLPARRVGQVGHQLGPASAVAARLGVEGRKSISLPTG